MEPEQWNLNPFAIAPSLEQWNLMPGQLNLKAGAMEPERLRNVF
jgi:hypothetical protein